MKRIAIFAFENRDLNTYPSIVNTIKLLTQAGLGVTVYVPNKMKTKIKIAGAKIVVLPTQEQSEFVQMTVRHILKDKQNFGLAIAFYYEGLVVTSLLESQHGIKLPTIFQSQEIFYQKQKNHFADIVRSTKYQFLSMLAHKFKMNLRIPRLNNFLHYHQTKLLYSKLFLESWDNLNLRSNELIPFCVVQDKYRAKAMYHDMPFLPKKHFLVPNSYIGFDNKQSGWAHKKFGIEPHKKIILYTGGFESGFDLGILDQIDKLDDSFMLFLNVFSRDGYLESCKDLFKDLIAANKLIINTTNLIPEDYHKLVSDSYIGLAWYSKVPKADKNMYWLGWSSGKLTKFLSCGKPVIAPSYLYRYKELIEDNNLGKTINSSQQLNAAIQKIESKYSSLTSKIKTYYTNELEFTKKYQPVINEIKQRFN